MSYGARHDGEAHPRRTARNLVDLALGRGPTGRSREDAQPVEASPSRTLYVHPDDLAAVRAYGTVPEALIRIIPTTLVGRGGVKATSVGDRALAGALMLRLDADARPAPVLPLNGIRPR
jgi:hypothetical protein